MDEGRSEGMPLGCLSPALIENRLLIHQIKAEMLTLIPYQFPGPLSRERRGLLTLLEIGHALWRVAVDCAPEKTR